MAKPVRVFIDRKELIGYTGLTLRRRKEDMTGELQIDVFMGYLPGEPPMAEASAGREVLVYVGGHLAFTGAIDRRKDSTEQNRASNGQFASGSSPSSSKTSERLSIGPTNYTVSFTCRGKTKYIIDCAHQHPSGTILRPTSKGVFDELSGPYGVEVQWEAEDVQMDKVRLRDGGHVVDELQRVAAQNSLYIHETRDGKIKVTDGTQAPVQGEPIVLGTNILSFSTDQMEDPQRSEIIVKGQRIERDIHGEDAVLPNVKKATTGLPNFSPTCVQHYGNADPASLEKRAQFEANKRNTAGLQVTLEVFHVQQTDGTPWDIGDMHYVEIPPAGVFNVMEVIELEYRVENDKTLKTTLTLAPVPVSGVGGGGSSDNRMLSGVPEVSDLQSFAQSRLAASGQTPLAIWGSPTLSIADPIADAVTGVIFAVASSIEGLADQLLSSVSEQESTPPLTLPPEAEETDNGGR